MEKVKWGVLGCGKIGEKHTFPALQKAGNAQLIGIASRDLQKAEAFRERCGFQKAYGSYEALLEDPEIQAVYLPLPNHLHLEWVQKAAAKGKHILCEKPLSGNAEDTKRMIQCCEAAGVVFMEAFAYLHSPIIEEIRKSLQKGEIGSVTVAESVFFVRPPKQGDIRLQKETLGGSVYDLGCYPLSLFLYLFGESPCEVKAAAHFTETGVDDFANLYLEYQDGKKAVVSCGMCSGQRADRFFLYGTEGTIEAPVSFNEEGKLHFVIRKGNDALVRTVAVEDNYQLEFEQMGRCILEGEKPKVSPEFSLENAKTIDRVLEAIGY